MLTSLFLSLALTGSEWVLWLLMLLSLVSIAMIVDRILFLQRTKVDAEQLRVQIDELLKANNLRGAWQLVGASDAIECQVVAAGLVALRNGPDQCSEAMASVKAQERGRLDAGLAILGTIGSNAPFVGLLGTVLGIIKAAHDLAAETAGQASPNAVMSGVFEALVATAVGLMVAIPAVVAFNYFQRRVRSRIAAVDALAHLVLSHVPGDRKAAPPTPPAPAPVPAAPERASR